MNFQDIEPFSHWGDKVDGRTKPLAEGAFGKVYAVDDVLSIQVGNRLFRKVAMKVPKPSGVSELRGEVESLGGLSREYTHDLPVRSRLWSYSKGWY